MNEHSTDQHREPDSPVRGGDPASDPASDPNGQEANPTEHTEQRMHEFERVEQRMAELGARVEGAIWRLDDLEQIREQGLRTLLNHRAEDLTPDPVRGQPTSTAAPESEQQQEEVELMFPTLAVFVEAFFAPMYARPLSGSELRWCARWWDHAEAVQRLWALWERYEVEHREPGGLATWLQRLDAQLPVLLGPTGPFARCKANEYDRPTHDPLPPLPTSEAPPDDPVHEPGSGDTDDPTAV